MKNLLEFIKKMWANERGRAFISLLLWGLFFIICFILLQIKNSSDYRVVEEDSLDNYEYNLVITINNSVYNIDGIRYQDKELLEIKETNKEYINEFSNIKELLGLDIKYLKMEDLLSYVSYLSSKREISYQDGKLKSYYDVPVSTFKINEQDTYVSNEFIEMQVLKEDNKVSNITLNLTNKMKLTNNKITNYTVSINYTNIGNIKDFAID